MGKSIKTVKDTRSSEDKIKELRIVIKSLMTSMEHIYGRRFDIYPLEKPLNSKIRTLGDWKQIYNNEGELRNV